MLCKLRGGPLDILGGGWLGLEKKFLQALGERKKICAT